MMSDKVICQIPVETVWTQDGKEFGNPPYKRNPHWYALIYSLSAHHSFIHSSEGAMLHPPTETIPCRICREKGILHLDDGVRGVRPLDASMGGVRGSRQGLVAREWPQELAGLEDNLKVRREKLLMRKRSEAKQATSIVW